jgi:serine/threonine-protein kinase RsbW
MRANLTTICSSEVQGEIREFLHRYISSVQISESEQNQIILAIDEAIANAIIHGNKSDVSRTLVIDLDISEQRLVAEISDIGLFNPREEGDKKKLKELSEVIKERQKGGLGLKLIYSVMDVVCFYTTQTKSFCLLIKLFKTGPAKKESKPATE